MRYSIVIHKDETSSYGVTVPDYNRAKCPRPLRGRC